MTDSTKVLTVQCWTPWIPIVSVCVDMKPPDNVLFICKLNPYTESEDLELIFSRFDPDVRVEIIRDPDTGDSLQYAFAEFKGRDECTEAYFKMNNALVDNRWIRVDFSQSVAKIWNRYTLWKREVAFVLLRNDASVVGGGFVRAEIIGA